MFPVHESVLRRLTVRFDVPLVQNDLRSAYVEEQIAILLGSRWRYAGADWGPFDFESEGVRLEVKQSAALQSWRHTPGRGSFNIAPKKGVFVGPLFESSPGRHADLYVFAWHGVIDQSADHRDVNQWTYFVCPTESLPMHQRSLTRARLEQLDGVERVGAGGLSNVVERLAQQLRDRRSAPENQSPGSRASAAGRPADDAT